MSESVTGQMSLAFMMYLSRKSLLLATLFLLHTKCPTLCLLNNLHCCNISWFYWQDSRNKIHPRNPNLMEKNTFCDAKHALMDYLLRKQLRRNVERILAARHGPGTSSARDEALRFAGVDVERLLPSHCPEREGLSASSTEFSVTKPTQSHVMRALNITAAVNHRG